MLRRHRLPCCPPIAQPPHRPRRPATRSNAGLGGAVDVAQLVEFVDSGRDLLLAAGSDVSEELRELAQELGVDLDAS